MYRCAWARSTWLPSLTLFTASFLNVATYTELSCLFSLIRSPFGFLAFVRTTQLLFPGSNEWPDWGSDYAEMTTSEVDGDNQRVSRGTGGLLELEVSATLYASEDSALMASWKLDSTNQDV